MGANSANRNGNGARSGAQTLTVLAAPLNVAILEVLAHGRQPQSTLRLQTGSPAQTTLRAQLKKLGELKAIDKHRHNAFPGMLEYELTASGRGLAFVATVLADWLSKSPDGALPLGDGTAKAAIKAFGEGWSSTMLRALAARPISLTELDSVIPALSYPALERRLSAMRLAGLLEPGPTSGRRTPYVATEWLRRGVAPLLAAARWERRHLSDTTPALCPIDFEAAFLLALPLLRLPSDLNGACRIATELPSPRGRYLSSVNATIESGRVIACTTSRSAAVDAWAVGPPMAWLDAAIRGDGEGLEVGGNGALAIEVVGGMHRALFHQSREGRIPDSP